VVLANHRWRLGPTRIGKGIFSGGFGSIFSGDIRFTVLLNACEIGNYTKAFSIYSTIDGFLRKRGFYRDQVRLLELLISQWSRNDSDIKALAQCFRYLGIAYRLLGQYQRAIDFHQQSLEIKREIGDRNGEAVSLGNLGNAYQSLGQYQRAIDFYQQWLEIAHEISDRGGEANSLWNLASL
jgi:tetratricopeptide (TPR) repeat protein